MVLYGSNETQSDVGSLQENMLINVIAGAWRSRLSLTSRIVMSSRRFRAGRCTEETSGCPEVLVASACVRLRLPQSDSDHAPLPDRALCLT